MSTRRAAAASALVKRCPICWDDICSPVLTPCGHRFCEKCIKTALSIKRECPTCRSAIASHRMLRADTDFAALTSESDCCGRLIHAEEAAELTKCADDTWTCSVCTLENQVAAGRCIACAARRPSGAVSQLLLQSSRSDGMGSRRNVAEDDDDERC